MDKMSLEYLVIDHNKAIKVLGYLMKTNKWKMSMEAAPLVKEGVIQTLRKVMAVMD